MDTATVLNVEKLQPAVHAALRAWQQIGGTSENLLAFLLLIQEQRKGIVDSADPAALRLATNQVLLKAIDMLEMQDQESAQVLRSRFTNNKKIVAVANQMNVSEHTVSRLQRKAIEGLTKVLFDQEVLARNNQAQTLEAFLPPSSYTHLFGFDDACSQLLEQLLKPTSPWVIAVVGIGGIGKTALADKVARLAIQHFWFNQVIWLRADPQTMSGRSHSPQLTYENLVTDLAHRLWPDAQNLSPNQRLLQVRQTLQAQPHLIIIDNLETESETAYLLNQLNNLADPSKFLLTSRTRTSELAPVYNFLVDELSFDDAAALVYQHAKDIGVHAVTTATKADIEDVFAVTGGNPLALKLVVSLLDLLPLPQILTNLQRSKPGPVENLYRHIYWQTWKMLSPNARALLQAMPLVAETGGEPTYLQSLSRLTDEAFWPALQELRSRSLIEVRGTIHEKQYGIHRLTETFLRTEIINWTEDSTNGRRDQAESQS